MEFHPKKPFWDLLEETHTSIHSSPRRSASTHRPDAEPRPSISRLSSATAVSLSPSSPTGSPWTLSPLRRSPAPPSILYHRLASLERHDGDILSLAVSRGVLFTGSDTDRVRAWAHPDCGDRGRIRTGHGGVHALLSCGGTLFTAHRDRRVRAWNVSVSDRLRAKKLATLPPKHTFFGLTKKKGNQHKDLISCIACYFSEGILYTGSWDCTVKAWRLAGRECVDSFTAHEGRITAMVVNQADGCLFTASADGSVKLWRRVFGDGSHTLVATLRSHPSAVNAVALGYTDGACFLYAGSSDGYINVWEKEGMSGRFGHVGFLPGHRLAVLCVVAAERVVFSGSEDATIRVWRREEGNSGVHVCVAVMEGHRGPVRCLAARVEVEEAVVAGVVLYSASTDRTVKVWRVRVLPVEDAKGGPQEGGGGEEEEEVAYTTTASPVLSPLWVEKKKVQRGLLY